MEKEKEVSKKILVVDDHQGVRELVEEILVHSGYEVRTAKTGEEALSKIKDIAPDLIILDIMMPGMDGIEVKSKLNENTSTASIPVMFLTGLDSIPDKIKGLHLGIDDYITKPFHVEELRARVKSVLDRRKFYEEISMTDGLTGLYNVHYFKKEFSLFFNMAKRYNQVFSLAIVDVDKFKSINDEYTHTGGDFVLKTLSSTMRETMRKSDLIVRYGGDEFVVILPGSDGEQSKKAMERVKEKIEGKEFTCEDTGKKISFTISSGIATYDEKYENEAQMFEIADKNMYKEKN